MKRLLLLVVLLVTAQAVFTQDQSHNSKIMGWMKLVQENDKAGAEKLCTPFLSSSSVFEKTEAHKCMANVVLMGSSGLYLEGDDAGGGMIRDAYVGKAVDEAIQHLDAGIALSPQDLSIHQGRLHILEMAGRYGEMVKAVDESANVYKGPDVPNAWLAYCSELFDMRQYKAALEFTKVLDKHYPNNPDIIGDLGAFLMALKKDEEALVYLKKSVELAPNDPINAWDLGREYDFTNQIQLADEWYKKSLSLMTQPDQIKKSTCLYGQFVENKLHDRARACDLEKRGCDSGQQSACEPVKPDAQ